MPKPRASRLETPTARRKLTVRKKPYYVRLSPGIHLGYRRNVAAGTWTVRVAESGAEWIKKIALADDLEAASPPHVLSYWQALDTARALARRQPGEAVDESRPLTVSEALTLYEKDLVARGSSPYNAEHPRIHLPGVLLNKPVALLGATELRKWRDSLLAKGLAPGTVNRTKTGLRAALELAAAHDPRIANQRAWKVGLAALPDAHRARNVILTDDEVRRIVAAAYQRDRALGLMTEVAAVTGARLSQIARLEAGDLQADRAEPRVLMPCSAKGRMRNKRHERRPVPITSALASVLKQEAQGRAPDAPLLLRGNVASERIAAEAAELGPFGIRVNMVAPGYIDTERRYADWYPEFREAAPDAPHRLEQIPLGRLGRPEEIADACLFLASDASAYITGDVIRVMGGRVIS